MRKQQRDIADELRNFVPEVESTQVDEAWEKIKYFLPQEKRKRRFFYLFLNGAGTKIAVIVALMLGLFFTLYFKQVNKQTQSPVSFNGRAVAGHPSVQKSDSKHHLRTSYPVKGKQTIRVERKENQLAKVPGEKFESRERQSQTLVSGGEKALNTAPTVIAEKKVEQTEKSEGLTTNYPIPDTQTESPETYFHLQRIAISPVPFTNSRTDTLVLLPFDDKFPLTKSKIHKKLALEFLCGGVRSQTLWYQENSINEQLVNNNGFFAGAKLIYSPKNKWSMNLGYTHHFNNLDLNYETTGNKVVSTNTVDIVVTYLVPDTLYKYFSANTNHKLTSVANSFMNCGLGYTLVQQRKFAMELLLQMSLRSAVYKISTTSHVGTDTLTYVKSQGKPTLGNGGYNEENDQKISKRLTGFGFTSGFNIVYAMNTKTSLIVAPAFFLPISNNLVKAGSTKVMFNQRNWFIGLGIRRYL